ncbi:MAG: PSD1 domain-containing protein [Lunatimonas sp.]|uniref:PSD1 and planctomycete cytochrome C domain-containing protein n=1 Tax=Lunatimonas sp. TaxID=2060141 RepID=UPI00263BA407|nr:PSD1 and planctomycete cytochrome C domain-containing protein [Lunatimonas sp.]MCC5936933.1 PSD1 domain-containing protein [Lunatimonas sp.]
MLVNVLRVFPAAVCGWLLLVVGCGEGSSHHGEGEIPEVISYNLHIRPILSENCFACHGPDANKREAGLRLDSPEEAFLALRDSPGSHAWVPGSPKASVAFQRVVSTDPNELMPPPSSNLTLSDRDIKLLEKWLQQGARYEPHWAFIPPTKADLPTVAFSSWPKHPLDYFILEKQEKLGLKPNPESDPAQLLRRVTLDLTGLPPTFGELNAFIADPSLENYEKVVDELLARKTYGEKMAVHWMDLARYADSHGYQDDYYRTQWPWRDWVIHAFNQNLSYESFVTWQLAGDLMPDATKETLLATAFNRNHKITEESGAIDEEYRVEYVVDRANTVGKAFLGLTLECAQCHDHKYDPISQKEYFQVYAFFNQVAEYGIEESTPGFSRKSPAKHPLMEITDEDVTGILSFVNRPDSTAMSVALIGDVKSGANFHALQSETGFLRVSVMGDLDTLRSTYILERGDYEAHGERVGPGTPKAVLPFGDRYPSNRLGLAYWLFDRDNPLTARVFVNRLWMQFFGEGIVDTPGDFGMQGSLPSHPELLDWLAVDFMESGWDMKHLVKTLVMSATYRQSSTMTEEKRRRDPDNKLFSRFPRMRLPAEHIRDVVLASSGLLVPEIGGPSVKPYQPPGLWELATSGRGNLATYKQDSLEKLYRRGLYTFIKRTVPPPSMILFDASNRDVCEVERTRTNTPLQALVMLNDPTVLEASRVLAATLLRDGKPTEQAVKEAFTRIVGRIPDSREIQVLVDFHQELVTDFREDEANASKLLEVGDSPIPTDLSAIDLASLMQVIHTLYNMEETITKS